MEFNIGITEIIAVISLLIAVAGAVLGILNTIHRFSKDKVKLRVVPKVGVTTVDSRPYFFIDVINRSSFPITIAEIGLKLRGFRKIPFVRTGIQTTELFVAKRLEPREKLSVNHLKPLPELIKEPDFASVTCAYIRTDCDEIYCGNNNTLKSLVKEARKRLKQRSKKSSQFSKN